MSAITLYSPVKQGRDWLLGVELVVGNDTFIVSAALSPETIAWAKRMIQRKSARLLELFAWVKDAIGDKVSLRGGWGKFGALGKLARDVANNVANGSVFVPDEETIAAAKIYTMALGGDPQAQKYLQAKGQNPVLIAVRLAQDLLKQDDWYERSKELCSLANSGDAGSRAILEAVYAFREPELSDDPSFSNTVEPVAITYDLTHAISAPTSSSKQMAHFINHYRHARLAPYKPDLDAFAGLLGQHVHVPSPVMGNYRRGAGFDGNRDLMIRTGVSRF